MHRAALWGVTNVSLRTKLLIIKFAPYASHEVGIYPISLLFDMTLGLYRVV